MADGWFLALGLDPQLLTAGSLGGLVKGLVDRVKAPECIRLLVIGAITGNFFAIPAVDLASSGIMFGFKLTVDKSVAAVFVGGFSMFLIPLIAGWISKRFSGNATNG